ncbi:BF3164 family lipoprotein [Flavobacteriaceae bacterium 14752]|uniref:BF3164 family lipoprotein n=1 Tax=Mesohalobacter salilacus TaxID=2491711 RepID=UPI000F636380|nr:hypothetical protein EIG84_04830 [Flavobacteriaceae bacterium 14752]
MNTTKYFLFFTYFLVLLSCDNQRANFKYYSSFGKNINLKGKVIKNISDRIYPQSINIYKDKIIFCDYSSNPHFYAYQLPDFKFIASFGYQGKGPLDINSPVVWSQIQNGKIGIYQMNLMKFDFYHIDDLINNRVKKNQLNPSYMPPEINDAINIISLKNDIYIGTGVSSTGEYFVFNQKTKKFYWRDYFKFFDKKFNDRIIEYDLMSELNLGIIKIKPDKTMFVKTNIYNPLIHVYDNSMDLKFTIANKNITEPIIDDSKKFFSSKTKMYYTNCYLTDKFIYAVYRNCTLEEYNNYECDNVEIHTFDWEGNPVVKYLLNEGIAPLSPFVVDEQRLKIYTVNPKTEDSYYSIFNIK